MQDADALSLSLLKTIDASIRWCLAFWVSSPNMQCTTNVDIVANRPWI